jgi:hypothetical protein
MFHLRKRLLTGCSSPANRIIYEVSIKLDNPVSTGEFMSWLRHGHIQQVLSHKGFLAAELYRCRESSAQGENGNEVVVRYTVSSPEDLDDYIQNHAQRLRQDAVDKFGDRMVAHRRIMGLNGTFYKDS